MDDLGRTAHAEDQAHRAKPETGVDSVAKRARLGEDICVWRNALDGRNENSKWAESFKENGPQKFICATAWSLVGGTI